LAAALLAGGLLAPTAGCGSEAVGHTTCDDLLPVDEARFDALFDLVSGPGSKSCSGCHNTRSPLWGYNFEGRGTAYDALANKMHLIYPQVVSGTMPQNGTAWDEADLQLLRSWYCYGATYD